MCHRIISSVLSLDPVPHIVELFVNRIVQDLNVGSLHSGGAGLNHACGFKLAQRIDNHRAGDAGLENADFTIAVLRFSSADSSETARSISRPTTVVPYSQMMMSSMSYP